MKICKLPKRKTLKVHKFKHRIDFHFDRTLCGKEVIYKYTTTKAHHISCKTCKNITLRKSMDKKGV